MKMAIFSFVIAACFIAMGFWHLMKHGTDLTASTARMIRLASAAAEGMFVIHVPDGGCPEGWKREPRMFQKGDAHVDACVLVKSQNGEISIDHLEPGESIEGFITIRPPSGRSQI